MSKKLYQMERLLALFLIGFSLWGAWSFAQASLLISPTRMVFDERDRGQKVVIVNTGNTAETYRLSLIRLYQTPDGGYRRLKPKEHPKDFYPANKWLRFSPKQVTLAPHERQVVRLSLRKPPYVAAGEYRAHLSFKRLPDPVTISDKKHSKVRIFMLPSFSIPVVVRQGGVSVSAKIVSAQKIVQGGKLGILVKLQRSGNFSAFGKVTLAWRANADLPFEKVTELNNVAIYREQTQRTVWLGLSPEQIRMGEYQVTFQGGQAFQFKVFDRYRFSLNGE